jgi:glutathione gamma-glutamylcysteinyltransferase
MLDIEALEGETMNSFFKLIPSDQTQSEPACCGFASLVMVLNALAVDPGRTWKGDNSILMCPTFKLIKVEEILCQKYGFLYD